MSNGNIGLGSNFSWGSFCLLCTYVLGNGNKSMICPLLCSLTNMFQLLLVTMVVMEENGGCANHSFNSTCPHNGSQILLPLPSALIGRSKVMSTVDFLYIS